MNLTNASTVASAVAAVVGTAIAVATFVLQLKKSRPNREPAAEEPAASPTGERASGPSRVPDRATHATDERAGWARTAMWLRKTVISVFSGVIAGVIVLFLASSRSPGPTVSLASSVRGADVSRTKVFHVTGTSSHLGNDTIWLTDYDSGYTVDSQATVYPDGTWEAADSDVGNSGQSLPFPLNLRVILADVECATRLNATMNSNGDYLTALPGGCTVAGAVTVNVTRP